MFTYLISHSFVQTNSTKRNTMDHNRYNIQQDGEINGCLELSTPAHIAPRSNELLEAVGTELHAIYYRQ